MKRVAYSRAHGVASGQVSTWKRTCSGVFP